MKITFLIRKTLLSISILIIFSLQAKAQDYNFSSEYNTLRWPLSLSLQGGITGDDGNYKRLTLFHGNAISFETGSNTIDYFKTRMVIDANGNIGIGTTSPITTLQVVAGTNQGVVIGTAGGSGYPSWLGTNGLYVDGSARATQYIVNGGNAIQWGYGQSTIRGDDNGSNDSYLSFTTGRTVSPAERMRIIDNGNVGIGTTSPDAKLAVKGTIHSQEVKVDLNVPGPDYVFQSDYKLTLLTDLKTFVDKNHHLPEIPSADEMTKNGLNLGDINIKLLKKVEELTLYMIDKDKQMTNQQNEINQLKTQLGQLIKEIHKN